MLLSVARLTWVNPFNMLHLQLVHDGLLVPSSSLARPPGIPRQPCKLAATAKEYSCEYGWTLHEGLCTVQFWGGLTLWAGLHCCRSLGSSETPMQVDPQKDKGLFSGFSVTLTEDGVHSLAKGSAPTFIGYSVQGLCEFGFYQVFRVLRSNTRGEGNWLPLASITAPGCLCQGLKAFHKRGALLWMRQTPYTMMKFACFQCTVEALYKLVVPKPRSERSKAEQLVVTSVVGYAAGVFCAVVFHPMDSVVSVLNKEKGSSASQVIQGLGFQGLRKTPFARVTMIGTLTALQWLICDSVKVSLLESLKKKLGLTQQTAATVD